MSADKDDSERQQVEWVFGLGGGELNDEPWNGFAYNYDGVPEYTASDFPDRFDHEYRTVIGCFLFCAPPHHIVDDAGQWTLQATYASSGENECPFRQFNDPDIETAVRRRRQERFGASDDGRCYLCGEERPTHGHVWLGDGWCEAVYKLASPVH